MSTSIPEVPGMSIYNEEIGPLVRDLQQARENDSTAEKQDMLLKSLNKLVAEMLPYCLEQKITLLPLYQRGDVDARIQARAQEIVNVELKKRGLPTWNESYKDKQLISISACGIVVGKALERPHYDAAVSKRMFESSNGESQYAWSMDSSSLTVQVYGISCGPRLCGELEQGGTCGHGLIYGIERYPEWIDGKGWENENPFHAGHEGRWPPKYTFDHNGNRTGPHY
jgi:hypothetical protein